MKYPKQELTLLIEKLNILKNKKLKFIDNDSLVIPLSHNISGNPSRFTMGNVRLFLDTDWKINLSKYKIIVTSLLTFPLLLLYGYHKE